MRSQLVESGYRSAYWNPHSFDLTGFQAIGISTCTPRNSTGFHDAALESPDEHAATVSRAADAVATDTIIAAPRPTGSSLRTRTHTASVTRCAGTKFHINRVHSCKRSTSFAPTNRGFREVPAE